MVLAGDICVTTKLKNGALNSHSKNVDELIQHCCNEFNDVIMICGNHESYNGNISESYQILKSRYKKHGNLHILDNEKVIINGVTFLGGTMWSDCNQGDKDTLMALRYGMNDFKIITNSNNKEIINDPIYGERMIAGVFTPENAWGKFLKFVSFLEANTFDKDEKIVVVSHHAPSFKSVHPKYRGDFHLNGGYCSDLEDFIRDREQIKVWICGHVHHKHEYYIKNTKVVCNPRGYINNESIANYFTIQTVEI